MKIDGIVIKNFAPFAAQRCRFEAPGSEGNRADVHIFVGENGTGKTRLLSLLIAACGNQHELEDRASEGADTLVIATTNQKNKVLWFSKSNVLNSVDEEAFESSAERYEKSKPLSSRSLGPNFGAVGLKGMAFRSVAAIRDEKLKPMAPVEWGEPKEMLLFSRPNKDSVNTAQAVANMKIRAGMNVVSDSDKDDDRIVRMTAKLEQTMTKISGRSFMFVVQQVNSDIRLLVKWGGIQMRLHQLPDGLRGIIGWLATCVARLDLILPEADNPLEAPILLFLDEPETHLHPAWQRQILPALQLLLPKAQIFVATHSPFIVSSVNHGWIYVLKADANGSVRIAEPRPCSQGDTYIDAVEDVLGLKEWYDPETELMLSEFRAHRKKALADFAPEHKAKMVDLARDLAKRSESLQVMMGQELAQFEAKEKLAGHKGQE